MAQSIQALWQQAQAQQAQGALDAAEETHRKIVSMKPDALPSWQFLSARAAKRGDYRAASHAIRQYLKVDDVSPEGWRSLGLMEAKAGHWDGAYVAFQETLKLQPGGRANLLYLGGAAQKLGKDTLAADCFSLVLQGMPAEEVGAFDAATEPVLQDILSNATAFLQGYVAGLVAGEEGLEGNLKGARWRFHEVDEPAWNHPQQKPERFFLPALKPKAWFDDTDLEWAKDIEAAHQTILDEVTHALSEDDATPYIADHMVEAHQWQTLAGNRDWSAVHLYNGGIPNDRLIAQFPRTMEVLEKLPLCRTGDRPVEVFFSLLKEGTHIVPHHGTSNARLTVHLPIIVPGGGTCTLRAGDETKVLEAGKLIAFDDSFDHEARNDGNGLRVNLIFETWNPALSKAEQKAVSDLMDRYDAWFAGRGRRMEFLGVSLAEAMQAAIICQKAEQALTANREQARGLFNQALALHPKQKRALKHAVDLAFEADDHEAGLALLRRLGAEAPAHAITQYRLGVVEEQIGSSDRARDAYLRCVKADPRNLLAWLYAGYCLEGRGDVEAAAQLYSLGADVDPRLTRLHQMQDTDPETAKRSKSAFGCLSRKMVALHSEATNGVPRIRDAIWVQFQDKPIAYREQAQRPHEFYIPDLESVRYVDRGRMPWAATVEAAFEDIKAEFLAALPRADEEGRPYLRGEAGMAPEFDALKGSMNWTALDLYRDGKGNDKLLTAFPKTLAALAQVPLVRVGDEPFEVFFSLLKPKQKIPPHFGLSNHGITVHLPLVVPENCRLRVDQEWREWREGELVAFDDSFDHEAQNNSDELRAVLIFEVWHPDLSSEEIDAVRHCFTSRENWFRSRRLIEPSKPLQK